MTWTGEIAIEAYCPRCDTISTEMKEVVYESQPSSARATRQITRVCLDCQTTNGMK